MFLSYVLAKNVKKVLYTKNVYHYPLSCGKMMKKKNIHAR
jgi:hypothetical protein